MRCQFCGKEMENGRSCDCEASRKFMNQQPPQWGSQTPPPPMGGPTPPPMGGPTPPPMGGPTPPPMGGPTPPPPMGGPTTPPMGGPTPPPMGGPTPPPMGGPTPPPMGSQTPPPQWGGPAPQSSQWNGQQNQNTQYNQSNSYGQNNYNNQNANGNSTVNMQNVKDFAQKALNKDYGFMAMLHKLVGFGESDMNSNEDCFERGKKIVPELIESCEGEVPIKQYHVANFRSRLQWLWAEGRMQITNKRVIFRASGRSIIGKTTLQQEYIIDEIAGIEVSKGVRFSFLDFILVLLLLFPICATIFSGMVMGVFMQNETFGYVMACLFGFGAMIACFLFKKRFFFKALLGAASAGAFYGASTRGNGFFALLAGIAILFALFMLLLFALKPSVSISILSKAGTGSPIYVLSNQHFRLERAKEILPAADTDLANKEIGALISDIQKLGDYAIEKWKEK